MEMVTEQTLEEYTREKLKRHYENSSLFTENMSDLYVLYQNKFLMRLINIDEKEKLENDLLQSMQSQIFKGYALAREIYMNEETLIPDTFLQAPDNVLREMLPQMIIESTNDLKTSIRSEKTQSLISYLITKYENILPLCDNFVMAGTMFGAWIAFLDLRNDRKIEPSSMKSKISSRLYDPSDIWFIDPEKYIACEVINSNSEKWILKPWSSNYPHINTLGEIYINYISKEDRINMNQSLPIYIDNEQEIKDEIHLNIILEHNIPQHETDAIISLIVNQINHITGLPTTSIFLSLKN